MEGRRQLSATEAIALAQRTSRALVVQLRCEKEEKEDRSVGDVAVGKIEANHKGLQEALEQNEEVKGILSRSVYTVLDKGDVDARNLRQAYEDIRDEPALVIISPESGDLLLLIQGDECARSEEVVEKIVAAHKGEEAKKLATLLALTAVSRQNDDGRPAQKEVAELPAAPKAKQTEEGEGEERSIPERTTTSAHASSAKGSVGEEEKRASLPRPSTPEPLRNRNETSSCTPQAELNEVKEGEARAKAKTSDEPVVKENEGLQVSKRKEKQRQEKEEKVKKKKKQKQPEGERKEVRKGGGGETEKLSYTHCQLNIRLLNGESLTCNFEAADKLGDVYKYVRENRTDGSQKFSLKVPFSADNSTLGEADFGKSLKELDLGPRSLLILVPDAAAAGVAGSPSGSMQADSSPLLSLLLRLAGLLLSPVYYLFSLLARFLSPKRAPGRGDDPSNETGPSAATSSNRGGRSSSFADKSKKNKSKNKNKDDDQQYWNGNSTQFLSHNKDQ